VVSVTTLRKTALVCYRYTFEVSPTLKNICSYLFDKEGVEVDVYLDELNRDRHFRMPGVNIIEVLSRGLMSLLVRNRSEKTRRKLFVWYVRRRIRGYERIIVADFDALALADEMGADLSRIIYVSLESADLIRFYPLESVRRLLGSCALRVIQSSERAEDLTRYLGVSLPFEYLPVSSRPSNFKRNAGGGKIKIIYSGYFADWACLSEFVAAISKYPLLDEVSFTFQGHTMGTEGYLQNLQEMVSGLPNVEIDLEYYDDSQYMKMLSNFDIGLAFYKNIQGSANFDNMILSSGKIANYLWSGLTVITNIDCKETHMPPFMHMEPTEADKLPGFLEIFLANRDEYTAASYNLAKVHYDFDANMEVIYGKMFNNK